MRAIQLPNPFNRASSSFFKSTSWPFEHKGSSIRVAPIEHPFRGVLGAQNRHEIGFRAKRLTKRLRELVRRLEVGAQLEAQSLEKVKGEKVDVLPPVLPTVLRLITHSRCVLVLNCRSTRVLPLC